MESEMIKRVSKAKEKNAKVKQEKKERYRKLKRQLIKKRGEI